MASTIFLIPCYGYQDQLNHVLRDLDGENVLVIDDGSPTALYSHAPCIRHERNLGYGAAQKTGFQHALSKGFDRIVLVHGDNQYSASILQQASKKAEDVDILLGSRLLREEASIPWWRKWGNRFLTGCVNQQYHCDYTDLHTGGRIYSRRFLTRVPYFSFSNDFLFDHQILMWALQNQISIQEFPMPAKYDDSVSSISFLHSVRYGLGCIKDIYLSTSRRADQKTRQD